jgi:hypothetical protein
MVQVFDGTQVWARDGRGTQTAPEALAREARSTMRRDVVALLLAAKDGKLNARVLPDAKDAENRAEHVLEISGTDLNPNLLYIDAATGLIRKQAFTADGPGRPLIEDEFSDYRAVDGIQIPFSASRKVGSTPTVQRRVTDIKVNPPLDPALFKRPVS